MFKNSRYSVLTNLHLYLFNGLLNYCLLWDQIFHSKFCQIQIFIILKHYMSKKRDVHKLSKPIELRSRYQVSSINQFPSLNNHNGIINAIYTLYKSSSQGQLNQNNKKKEAQGVEIKMIQKLTDELYIVSNGYKLSIISIQFDQEDKNSINVHTICELSVNYNVIKIAFEKKKYNLVICGEKIFEIYRFDPKKQTIKKYSSYVTNKQIKFMEIFNENSLFVFYNDSCILFNITTSQITAKQTYEYTLGVDNPDTQLILFSVPKRIGKFINLFFYDKNEMKKNKMEFFSLYKAQLFEQSSQIFINKVIEIYKIQIFRLQTLEIINYDKDTIVLNLKTQILVLKKHYPIDSGTLNYKNQNSFLIYLQNGNLLHICDTRIEVHFLTVKFNSIEIKPCDSIDFIRPKESRYFKCFPLENDNFIVFFLPKHSKHPFQTKYWFTITIKQELKNKLQNLLNSKIKKDDPISKLQPEDLKDIQQVAKKMGLSKSQIFFELWIQSPHKKTQRDFDILLETQDYKLISREIKRSLKKQSIKFTQIQRIERACFQMLSIQISKNPTQINLLHYLKAHMMIRKYNIEKILESDRMSKKHKYQQIEQVKQIKNQNGPKQIKQAQRGFEMTIQDYTSIRRRNIKKYIIQMMMDITNPHKLEILLQYIKTFKMIIRIIFNDFISEVIQILQSKFFDVLVHYVQILPVKQFYSNYRGIWGDIKNQQWEANIFFDKLQTVDNIQILSELMKMDKFKWDYLIRHDFIKIKRVEFEAQFKKYREAEVFYVIFEKLFLFIKDNKDNLQKIIKKIEDTYIIPPHLKNKIFLYWQLHKFFIDKCKLLNYNMTFKQLLSLSQQKIFEMIFHHEKNCKQLILNQIKSIYNKTFEQEKYDYFNIALRKYFQEEFSTVSDLKYLLNRINNQKFEYHQQNQNLYRVLVDSTFHKLDWKIYDEIPINEILIYFHNIPLLEQELNKLKLICIVLKIENDYDNLFSKLDLKINLRYFFDHPEYVIKKLIESYIGIQQCKSIQLYRQNPDKVCFLQIFKLLRFIRDQVFCESISDEQIMEYLISIIMNFDDLIFDLEKIIYHQKFFVQFKIQISQFLEKIIEEKINKAFETRSNFIENQSYITMLINLLRIQSPKKLELQSHLNLGLVLSILKHPPPAPLVHSSRFIFDLLKNEKTNIIKQLDIEKIYDYMVNMGMKQKKNSLYAVLIKKYLMECEWKYAIKYVNLWNKTQDQIIFSALLAMKVGQQLPKQLKQVIVQIILMNYHQKEQLVNIIQKAIDTVDSKKRKQLLLSIVTNDTHNPIQFYESNWLLSKYFKQISNNCNIEIIVKYYQQNIRNIDLQFQKNENYYLYYRLLFCQPLIAYKYFELNIQNMDLTRFKTMFLELINNCRFFSPLELILFFYKSLLCIFFELFQNIRFQEDLKVKFFVQQSLVSIKNSYQKRILELRETMTIRGEIQKFQMIIYFSKLYTRQQKCSPDQKMSLDVENDRDQFEFKLKKELHIKKGQDKKKIYQPIQFIQNSKDKSSQQNQVWESLKIQKQQNEDMKKKQFNKFSSVNYNTTHYMLESNRSYNQKKKPTSTLLNQIKMETQKYDQKVEINIIKSTNYIIHDQYRIQDNRSKVNSPAISRVKSCRNEKSQNKHTILNDQLDNQVKNINFLIRSTSQKYEDDKEYLEQQIYPVQIQSNQTNKKSLALIKEISKQQSKIQTSNKLQQENHQSKENIKTMADNLLNLQRLKQKQLTQMINQIKQQQLNQVKNKKNESDTFIKNRKISIQFEQQLSSKNHKQSQKEYQQVKQQRKFIEPINKNMSKSSSLKKKSEIPQINKLISQKQIQNKNFQSQQYQNSSQYKVNLQRVPINNQIKKSLTKSQQNQKNIEQQRQVQILQNSITSIQIPTIIIQQQQAIEMQDQKVEYIIQLINKDNFQVILKQFFFNNNILNEISILKKVVVKLYNIYTFKQILQIVDKIIKFSLKFKKYVHPQNLKIMKAACSTGINFDFRLIFPPETLYFVSNDPQTHSKALFKFLKPTLIKILNQINCFMVAKVIFVAFGYNKSLEYRVQYYYLQNLIKSYVYGEVHDFEYKMLEQKISALIQKLPTLMTIQRLEKLIKGLIDEKINKKLLINFLNDLIQAFQNKKCANNERYIKQIGDFENNLLEHLKKYS